MEALGHIGGGQAILPLWQWWTTGTAHERNQAIVALDRIMRRLPQGQHNELIDVLRRRYRPCHRADLLAGLEASDPIVQRAAISLAGWVREPEAVMPLVHVLGGELGGEAKQALSLMAAEHVGRLLEVLPRSTPTIYCALIELLAGTADPSVLPVMKEALTSIDPRVRRAATLGIAAQGDRDSAPALVGLLLDRDPEVQEAAVWALGQCRTEAAVASVITLLDEESPAIRVLAARILGLLQAAEGREPLARALHDPDPAVRTAAVVALDRLKDTVRGKPADTRGLAILNDHFLLALGDEAPSVRLEAARALQRREATLPVDWWQCLADDPDQWVRAVAARSAAGGTTRSAMLHKYLRDESGAVRIAALEAVAEHPEAGDAEAIRDTLCNEDSDVVTAALTALSAMASHRPALVSESGDRPHHLHHLIDGVLQTLLHPVWTVREAGMRALASLDAGRARRRLEQLAADDPHPRIRQEAARLLSSHHANHTSTQPTRSERR
jgi:HEAT repeat protein